MTATAVGAEFAIVCVVGAMAIAAGIANPLHAGQRGTVTVVAGNLYVGSA